MVDQEFPDLIAELGKVQIYDQKKETSAEIEAQYNDLKEGLVDEFYSRFTDDCAEQLEDLLEDGRYEPLYRSLE